ncbi:hypothetical protein BH10ACI3_BH10ACI3_14540 [soil metagenome]
MSETGHRINIDNLITAADFEGVTSIIDYEGFGVREILERTKLLAPELLNARRSRTLPGKQISG